MKSMIRSAAVATVLTATVFFAACYYDLPSDLLGLIAAMENTDMGVQAAAAERIDQLYGREGLLTALREGGAGARAQSARRLSRFREPDVVQALLPVAQNDSNRHVRYAAISSLGLIGDSKVRPVLEAMARDDDVLVRAAVEDALRDLDASKKK